MILRKIQVVHTEGIKLARLRHGSMPMVSLYSIVETATLWNIHRAIASGFL
jgi:hypothetical protein